MAGRTKPSQDSPEKPFGRAALYSPYIDWDLEEALYWEELEYEYMLMVSTITHFATLGGRDPRRRSGMPAMRGKPAMELYRPPKPELLLYTNLEGQATPAYDV
ncbi:hypothetical protein FJT64_008664 [Amphibalanus amphitrite]|uniref:Uncharacterized protein n=1 Tax=Amphibalanus amphitrite TaxID=1232801 RepID=A0A6A4VBA1_AMPAM|nr:hypothetical protein FJT64_008664 [Amphibalanus amphitrite]